MILRPPHLKCKCIYYVHDSCYFWRFSKSLCTTLLTLTWLVYLLEGSKCQGTLKRNVANLSTWNWNKITKLKKYQVAAFSTCFCPYPHLNLAMKNLLPMHSLGPLTQFNKCSFFFPFSSKSLVSKLVVHQLFVLIPKWPYLQHVISWIVD